MGKVSIIVPVYNVEKYIENCIESLIKQTHSDIEIILINDGSKDLSGTICDLYATKDNRIKVIHQNNEGVSVARNKGIEYSTGEWVCFVDGDDWAEDDMIEKLYKYAAQSSCDICIGSYFVDTISESKKDSFFNLQDYNFYKSDNILLCSNCINIMAFGNRKAKANVGVPWAKLYRREFLINQNIRFKPGLKRMQDAIFNLYAFYKAEKVIFRDIPVYHYRIFEESATNKYTPDFDITALKVLNSINDFINEFELKGEFLNAYYSKAIKLLLECIKLKYVLDNSNNRDKKKISEIRRLLKSEPYNKSKHKASFKYLNRTQKIGLLLIKFNMINTLFYVYKYKNSRNRSKMYK